MKVLYVSPNGYLGGAERFVVDITRLHQEHKNIECAILFYSDGDAAELARKNGTEVFVLKSKFKLSHPLSLSRAVREIRSIIKKYNPDVLHHTMPYAHITSSIAAVGLPIKKVWFQHGPVNGKLDQIGNFFPSDVIVYNSQDLKVRHHQSFIGPVAVTEEVIHLGVASLHSREIFQNPLCRLGSAGRICSWKGFHHILLALVKLRNSEADLPLKFSLAGSAKTESDQSYYRELEELIKTHQLEDIVEMKHHVSHMQDYYNSLDVFIHSSTIPEPFGLVVAEAMGMGCLVVGSNEGGVRDVLKDQQTGLSFNAAGPDAVDELALILKNIITSYQNMKTDDLKKLAKNGRIFVSEEYSQERMVSDVEKIYLSL